MVRKSKSLPRSAFRIRTYAELDQYAQAFADGHLNFLILLGTPGLGKGFHLRERLKGRGCIIEGYASAFGVYREAFEHRDKPLVLDDVDSVWRKPDGARFLKALCQTEANKTVGWHSDAPALEREGIPREFQTNSPVAIIANDWASLNPDIAALEDRGHVILFEPTPLEIHLHAAGWFWNQEIFDFVADHLHLLEAHSLRLYIRADELYEAGLDWKSAVLTQGLTGTTLAVAKLKANPAFEKEEDRIVEFVRQGHGCRATYFNHAKKLVRTTDVPQIKLKTKVSPKKSAKAPPMLKVVRR